LVDQICAALTKDQYHVLHLSAHGSPTSVELEDEDGQTVTVTAAELVARLKAVGKPLPLIMLSSCAGAAAGQHGLAAMLVRAGADRVIAMQAAVTDGYATRLAAAIYRIWPTTPPRRSPHRSPTPAANSNTPGLQLPRSAGSNQPRTRSRP
jgi:CHAT domain-containing protein